MPATNTSEFVYDLVPGAPNFAAATAYARPLSVVASSAGWPSRSFNLYAIVEVGGRPVRRLLHLLVRWQHAASGGCWQLLGYEKGMCRHYVYVSRRAHGANWVRHIPYVRLRSMQMGKQQQRVSQ